MGSYHISAVIMPLMITPGFHANDHLASIKPMN